MTQIVTSRGEMLACVSHQENTSATRYSRGGGPVLPLGSQMCVMKDNEVIDIYPVGDHRPESRFARLWLEWVVPFKEAITEGLDELNAGKGNDPRPPVRPEVLDELVDEMRKEAREPRPGGSAHSESGSPFQDLAGKLGELGKELNELKGDEVAWPLERRRMRLAETAATHMAGWAAGPPDVRLHSLIHVFALFEAILTLSTDYEPTKFAFSEVDDPPKKK